ncbi:MAG: hypothetical protein EKK53_21415 [Burkholderiales bacterium]|nr:MAG: hypothetical protein EKK53_21415 [Burkholderiales bacterium]
MKQYITTQLVEAEELEHGPFRVAFPSLGFGAVVLPEAFKAECHPIDRLEVGFGLALEGMKHGLRFRRLFWKDGDKAVGLLDGKLHWFVRGYADSPVLELLVEGLVAEDWVVAP